MRKGLSIVKRSHHKSLFCRFSPFVFRQRFNTSSNASTTRVITSPKIRMEMQRIPPTIQGTKLVRYERDQGGNMKVCDPPILIETNTDNNNSVVKRIHLTASNFKGTQQLQQQMTTAGIYLRSSNKITSPVNGNNQKEISKSMVKFSISHLAFFITLFCILSLLFELVYSAFEKIKRFFGL